MGEVFDILEFMARPKTVEEYIEKSPEGIQPRLKQLRTIILSVVPKETEEKISYSMPYYGYKGRLVYFRAGKNHIGFYIMPPIVEKFKKELKDYKTAVGTVQFPNDKPLPIALVKKLLKARVKYNEEK